MFDVTSHQTEIGGLIVGVAGLIISVAALVLQRQSKKREELALGATIALIAE